MTKIANSLVGYIGLLRQLASFARLGRRSLLRSLDLICRLIKDNGQTVLRLIKDNDQTALRSKQEFQIYQSLVKLLLSRIFRYNSILFVLLSRIFRYINASSIYYFIHFIKLILGINLNANISTVFKQVNVAPVSTHTHLYVCLCMFIHAHIPMGNVSNMKQTYTSL